MSAQTLLTSLLRHKAWADRELADVLVAQGHELPEAKRVSVLRLLDHAHAVDRIFVANLQRKPHGYASTEPVDLPRQAALLAAIDETDRWLIDHAVGLETNELEEQVAFVFTDGRAGRMSREEMLAHLIAHGGYHRGEIGRILTEQFGSSPPDTFTGYLRRFER
jgi:uncharacterized damage-inducible protein DinB